MTDSSTFDPKVKNVANCITARYDGGIQNQKSIGVAVIEPVICRSVGRDPDNPSNRQRGCNTEQTLELKKDGLSKTLSTVPKDNLVLEPIKIKRLGNLYDENAGGARAGNVYAPDGLAPALQTAQGGNRQPLIYENYRIRKLTPRECFRLMGFTDEQFDKARVGISDSQLYKMAGNSICVPVLQAIFDELFNQKSVFELR